MIKNLSKKKKKGFTLVELIVVIAIIGILAAVAVPKYSTYQEKARTKADIASARIIAEAAEIYLSEEGKKTISNAKVSSDITDLLSKIPKPQTTDYDEFWVSATDGKVTVTIHDTAASGGEADKELYPNN